MRGREPFNQALGLLLAAVLCLTACGGSGNGPVDADGDTFASLASGGDDCDDTNAGVNPEAAEIRMNGVDENCDGLDYDPADKDGDGYKNRENGGIDCNDDDSGIHPLAAEIPNDGIDEDCSGGDLVQRDADADGYIDSRDSGGTDCDDANPSVHPGAGEVPGNGIDENCDGYDTDPRDKDEDGFVDRAVGGNDCDDRNPAIHPGAIEVPRNGVDENCNGADLWFSDFDQDGYTTTEAGGNDCDDRNAAVHPGAPEILGNGIDENCDGLDQDDDDRDGYIDTAKGGDDCDDTNPGVNPGRTEIFGDAVDQNCDGWAPRGRILAIGDSVTAGVGDGDGGGYPSILEDLLEGEVENEGVGGEETSDMLDRIEDEIDSNDPEIVIILGGYNDIVKGRSTSAILGDIEEMVDIVRDGGRVAVVGNLHPTRAGHAYMNPQIDDLKVSIEELCTDSGAIFANTWGAFDAEPSLNALLTDDGLHPNHEGYEVMAGAFETAILNPPIPPP